MSPVQVVMGLVVASGVYFLTNPYIVINALFKPEILRSNFGNSLAMYEVARVAEGFVRVLHLTVEGATLPVLVFGAVGLVLGALYQNRKYLPLIVPALVFFLQFVLIGAGKPAEYGRFGIFTNTALVVGLACLIVTCAGQKRRVFAVVAGGIVVLWAGVFGELYHFGFRADASGENTRSRLARTMADMEGPIYLMAEPAPYCCPPLDFAHREVYFCPGSADCVDRSAGRPYVLFRPVDRPGRQDGAVQAVRRPVTPISWANKPFEIEISKRGGDDG